jgi:hypothetical protein
MNKTIPDYDVEQEYAIIERVIETEREAARESGNLSFWSIFKGTDGVSLE